MPSAVAIVVQPFRTRGIVVAPSSALHARQKPLSRYLHHENDLSCSCSHITSLLIFLTFQVDYQLVHVFQ
jgi:hypothetical protein